MKIENRDPSLKYPRAIKDEKTRLILDWLLEFRFSSIDLLARRIGSNSVNSNRFFNSILNDGIIQAFKNVHTKNERYVMLTSAGLSYLEVNGRDISKATTRVQHLGRYSHIIHDMAVQYAVLNRLGQFEEVIWDRHIELPEHQEKPDAILRSPKGYWVALEYERWRKDTKRIYITFKNHADALSAKHYAGVFYLFDRETDYKFYQKLFEKDEWPRYQRERKSGRIKQLDSTFRPGEIKNLKKCYVFSHEPVEQG
jgi:hypothetical protein